MSMGDGGVACMPSQHVMERLPISDTYCRGNGGFTSSKSLQFTEQQLQRKMVVEDLELENSDSSFNKVSEREIEKGEIVSDKQLKEEVEEGELALTVEVENGEFIPEKFRKREVEKGEFIPGKWGRGEVERGEFIPDKRQKWEVERGEYCQERRPKWESERGDFSTGRRLTSEIEKGEFVPDKWRRRGGQRLELERGEFVPYKPGVKGPKQDLEREDYGYENGQDRTSASAKSTDEDNYKRKELISRSGSDWTKRYSRWDPGYSRDTKVGYRAAEDDLGSFKNDGKSYNKDYSNQSWQKRQGTDPGNNSRRYHGDFADHQNSKNRRFYEDNNRAGYSEKHHSLTPAEKPFRNAPSSRISSSNRYSSKHYDSSVSTRPHDRHGPSPGYFDRSPHDRNRQREQQQQQRSPTSERSPSYYDHRNRSPLRRSPHRARHYDRRDHSPGYLDRSPLARGRSPHVRARHHDRRDRTPGYFDVSPRHDLRDRTPGYLEKSPPDCDPSPSVHVRQRNCRDRTPGHFERSPLDQGQPHDYQVDGRTRKATGEELMSVDELDHESKLGSKDSTIKDLNERSSTRHAQFNVGHDNDTGSATTNLSRGGKPPHVSVDCTGPPHVIEVAEEVSMEEDMDISNTPPHPAVDDSVLGTWSYLDHHGIEQGPSKLCNLKRLVEEGYLQSDHLIKHSGSDWWVTVENAASPLVPRNFPPIVSDTVSQLVSPPEAPGNLLEDAGESAMQVDQEPLVASLQLQSHLDDSSSALRLPEDLHIDDRVNALLKGYAVMPGRELETLGEALNMVFEHTDWERWGNSEGFMTSRNCPWEPHGHQRDGELNRLNEISSNDILDNGSIAPCSKDYAFPICDSGDWFSGRWSCKGGDWRRNDDVNQDKSYRRKLVLNDGYPLCQMPKSRCEDPRWSRKDELYYPSRSRKLNLPSWAFTSSEEKNDSSGTSRSSQIKAPLTQRGLKGTMLPVVRINACVVNNQASLVPEPRAMVRGNERYSSRSSRSFSLDNNGRSLSAEGPSQPRTDSEKCIEPIITPKDHVCAVNELQLHLGDWYYLDGAGHEHGPSSFGELHALAEKGTIQKDTSVFRKSDNLWIPVNSVAMGSKASVDTQGQEAAIVAEQSAVLPSLSEVSRPGVAVCSSSFNNIHPQFIGYTRGKLHELVMKSFKSREFAAAINEVLDPWINAKQPKKELESIQKFRRSEDDHIRAGKRARAVAGDSEDDYDLEGDLCRSSKDDSSFDDLCDATFAQEINTGPEAKMEGWGLLDGYILARVFHFLRADMKSLAVSASTCRHWNTAVKFYRDISKQVDFSEAGPDCSDSMFQRIMSCYNNSKIASLILIGCTNISAHGLEEILRSFPCISSIDIRGCMQFRELIQKHQSIKWINSRSLRETKIPEDSYSKIRTLKHITERGHSFSKAFKGSNSHLNEFHDGDLLQYDPSLDGRDSTNRSFQQSSFKRKKLLDSRNSSSLVSRDARIRHFLYRKSENGYKRMEEFLAFSLKDIMKENTFDFFIPRVAEIEDKMKSGYYKSRGLNSVKEDISRMCRDAIKAKSRGDARDMNHIIMLFIRLATSLEENANKSSRERDELLRMLKDKSKKKQFKTTNERKTTSRNNGIVYFNGGLEYGEYASDREVRRRLSKLNKRPLDSESETSDDHNHSSENTGDDSETTVSDTESDRDFRSEGGTRDGYFLDDEALDSTIEDREWGARMTKASLVPPVTRKYEVIDRYVITVDEDEVQRKMRVSLPEDYVEKLNAQKNGESDMEIPEVKDYKPRKQLGEEVLEQEVYGIDPYTHNLLLDSMPEELDWPLADKHVFIEDTLLRALNMQVRHFTGTGNAPMKYPLQPVVEEIQTKSEEGDDKRTMKMCQGILKAMRSRPEENYVAYRKGLGVVCNKEEGFGSDDFVVEFLGEVYPAWKWFEKQDGIKFFQKNNKDPAPEFYNIYLERPKGDRDGYDLVVVDAMHKANYASRICHSCRPNCEAKVTAVDGQYQIGVYTVRPIGHAEEITFDYNSVTESKEEYEASVCLCGSQICRGSYLNLTGEGAYQKILMECHGLLNRHQLMLEACELNFVSEEDYNVLGRAGLGTCLLDGLPPWLVAYSARLVRFINFERTKLPDEIFRRNLEEKRKFFSDISIEYERNDAEVQADGVYNSRLQNLALTLDKVRYVMRSVYNDPKRAPPPLRKLNPEEVVSVLWKGEGSLVEELLECMAPHTEASLLNALKSRIQDHDPSGSGNLMGEVKKSLLWLRDEVRDLPCTYKCRHDAAADLIHIYAYTKCFFRVQEYKTLTSPPVYISPLDVGPKYADKFGPGLKEYCKKYGENYCLGQLINWNSQNADPDCCLSKARRGCLSLPEIASFYAKANKPSRQRVYGPRTLRFMLSRMEKQPQRPWPKEKIWSFKGETQVFGSPMLDAVVNKSPLDKEMVHWLKSRPPIFQAKWDR